MATSEEVWKTALDLAERGEDNDTAVHELLACCGDHRVSVVVARQTLSDASGEDPPRDCLTRDGAPRPGTRAWQLGLASTPARLEEAQR